MTTTRLPDGELLFGEQDKSQTITVLVISGPAAIEPNETFLVQLGPCVVSTPTASRRKTSPCRTRPPRGRS